jgi:hypothetical protein
MGQSFLPLKKKTSHAMHAHALLADSGLHSATQYLQTSMARLEVDLNLQVQLAQHHYSKRYTVATSSKHTHYVQENFYPNHSKSRRRTPIRKKRRRRRTPKTRFCNTRTPGVSQAYCIKIPNSKALDYSQWTTLLGLKRFWIPHISFMDQSRSTYRSTSWFSAII